MLAFFVVVVVSGAAVVVVVVVVVDDIKLVSFSVVVEALFWVFTCVDSVPVLVLGIPSLTLGALMIAFSLSLSLSLSLFVCVCVCESTCVYVCVSVCITSIGTNNTLVQIVRSFVQVFVSE